jgi:hypothetical protein
VDWQRRLDELPRDLEEHYRHMFRPMESTYRQQASRVFQVDLRSSQIDGYGNLSVLQLSNALDGTLTSAIYAPRELPLAEDRSAKVDIIDKRLRGMCYGLLEINKIPSVLISAVHPRSMQGCHFSTILQLTFCKFSTFGMSLEAKSERIICP